MLTRPFLICLISFLFFDIQIGYNQDLEKIGKGSPLKVSGGISTNQIVYFANGITNRRQPYNYVYTGNLNLDFYSLNIPLSYTFSNNQSSFRQPFNQFSIHPNYKWVTLHAGYNSLVFSPYTLNGHIFSGAGVDLTPPGIFRFSAVYGRFLKPVRPDTNDLNNLPSYQRIGWGFKAGVGKNRDFIDFIFFRAKDNTGSLEFVPEEQGILPQENVVLSLNASKTVAKRFLLTGEVAGSAITRDIRADKDGSGRNSFYSLTGLYTDRNSSSYYKAIKSAFTYNANTFSIGVGYERIDPGYKTLGAYYFNNDLENYTINGTTRFMEGKINLGANVGTQRNNLDNNSVSNMRRLLGAFNIAYVPVDNLNLNISYSNFQTFTRIRSQFDRINQLTPYDNLDTLNYTQVSQSANFNGSYRFGEVNKKTISTYLSYNRSSDRQLEESSLSAFYNANTALNYSFQSGWGMTGSMNVTYNDMGAVSTVTAGPVIGVNKDFLEKKLRASTAFSYNNSYTAEVKTARIYNIRFTCNYRLLNKHTLTSSLVFLNRAAVSSLGRTFNEFTGNIGYSYYF